MKNPGEASLQKRRTPGRPKAEDLKTSVREALIRATISLVSTHGTNDVTANQVAALASVSPASINYTFGSWNGLIAEAGSVVYVEYVATIWNAACEAKREPEDRLRAYLFAQIEWAKRMSGWGALINYPISAREASSIMQKNFGHITSAAFQLNYARIVRLTLDLLWDKVTPFDYDETNYPREELLAEADGIKLGTLIGWISLGIAVWNSRGPTIESRIPVIVELQEGLAIFAIDTGIETIKNYRKRL